jgi:hypothetical protein
MLETGLIFMQDNAPIHTSHKVRAWFTERLIPLVDHPPYLKEVMGEALQAAWLLILQSYFDAVIASMPRRVEAVLAANGWHTKC